MIGALRLHNDFFKVDSEKEFNKLSFTQIKNPMWLTDSGTKPESYFKIAVLNNELIIEMRCYEENPKAVFLNRDDPVYRDSCLEAFISPVCGKTEYINIECNSAGAFLCEFGNSKADRVFVKSITSLSPVVTPFKSSDESGAFWGVTIVISKEFLCKLYKVQLNDVIFEKIRANFYNCGDDCTSPHYLAFSPVTTLPPGFHNPKCFADFKLTDIQKG